MSKYRLIVILAVLLLNIGSLYFTITASNAPFMQNGSLRILKKDLLIVYEKSIPPSIFPMGNENPFYSQEKKLNPQNYEPRFSVQQQQNTTLLNQTIDDYNESLEFVPDIWGNIIGSETYNHSLFTNGLIDPINFVGEGEGASLFTRIGNYGNNETTADDSLSVVVNDEYDVSDISAGWRINFSIQKDYEIINISFKWRFDAINSAFDNYTEIGGVPLDATPDYQEIRCRIKHTNEDQSFWIGNPVTNKNPNGTIFYRVGPNVVQDEVWYTFEYSFQVESGNFSLELGAYLNTREYWNEYFDVWFDDILIQGMNDISDNNPPHYIATGLDRTTNITQFKFWANFSEGTWETPIKNVTVFYNQTGTYYNKILNSSLDFQPPSSVNEAGYNQTHWQFLATFNFDDNISYYFVVYDFANNSFVSKVQSTPIGDYTAPEITSSVINQTGKGFIDISIDVRDWGYGIDTIQLNYTTLRGNKTGTINITDIGTIYYKANFSINISLDYGDIFEFGVSLNDTDVGNSEFYSGDKIAQMSTQDVKYPIELINDVIDPEILFFNINASLTTEDRTNVTVTVADDFGNISEVYLEVKYENGTPHEKYFHVILEDSGVSTGISAIYKLRLMEGEPLLKLPYKGSYNITVYVFDLKGNNDSYTYPDIYNVQDRVAPRIIEELDIIYIIPGTLTVRAQVTDTGSGISKVMLQLKTKNGWIDYAKMGNLTKENWYAANIHTNLLGIEKFEFRINAIDIANNPVVEENRPSGEYTTKLFFTTSLGLLITEIIVLTASVSIFAAIKIVQSQQLKALRRRRFDVALGRSERLAYLGEEAIFGFIAAYGQSEDVSSILLWEPRLIGHFYQYLKELIEKANNSVSFIMQAKPQDQVTYVDFNIEKIGCSAITFAYPVSTLPQQWLSALTLDQVPIGAGQGILLLILVMREKWAEIANNFQEEIADGMIELKDLLCSGENKDLILKKAREFRLFISGTLEVLDEIETETDEISDDIMGDFETEFLDIPDDDGLLDETDEDEPDDQETSNQSSDNDSI